MIHIYYGDGKGKTTAAVGLAARAAGNNMRVMFVQFLKTDSSGERLSLEKLDTVTLTPCPRELKFTFEMDEQEKQQAVTLFRNLFERSVAAALSQRYDMIILDEIFDAISEGMISEGEVFEFIANAPSSMEIVLTGHNPGKRFIETADYVTELKKIKHPYDKGVSGRIGIEF